MKKAPGLGGLLAFAQLLSGCYTYSAFQSARTLGPGEMDVTPSASFHSFHNDGEGERVTEQFGIQAGVGLPGGGARNLNLTVRYETLRFHENWDNGLHYLDLGLKVPLIPGRVALALPVGFYFGEDIESEDLWNIQPSLFLTLPAHERVDLNLSGRYMHFFNSESEENELVAFNGGLGLHLAEKVSLMPEVGFLFSPGEEGNYFHYGLGIRFRL